VADLSSTLTSDALAAAAMFNEETRGRLTDARWFEAQGDVVRNINFCACYADLAILGQNVWQEPPTSHPLPIADSVLLQCGRPILIMPAVVTHTHFKRIVIAWDGSREAVRAVHDALPFLSAATSVHVVTMIPASGETSAVDAESLVAHLGRHAVAVQAGVQQIKTDQEHDSLRKQIEHGHYDLLVMGGYSHSMWRDFIFGGATQSILMSSTMPVLVSH
jgi:nucleotide-binding universal stress UspA family protein